MKTKQNEETWEMLVYVFYVLANVVFIEGASLRKTFSIRVSCSGILP